MSHYHAAVWIDHREARVFHFNPTEVELMVVHPDNPTRQVHHKANSIGSGHAAADEEFLHAVAEALSGAGAILITGPGVAKTELVKHIHRHDPGLMARISAVETVDHPSDGALVAHARKYFVAADRMRTPAG
jgi:stalled ribosome rescue protein Dom34